MLICQYLFVFTNHIKHDRLIMEMKEEDIQSYGGLCSENKFFGKQHTDHQKIQRNEQEELADKIGINMQSLFKLIERGLKLSCYDALEKIMASDWT